MPYGHGHEPMAGSNMVYCDTRRRDFQMVGKLVALCAACALVLGACSSAQDVKEAADAKPTGSTFDKDLHKGYVSLAQAELKEGDQGDAKHFSMKAKEAAAGKAVAPDDFEIRAIGGPEGKTLKDARVRLISALGSPKAMEKPKAAAKAQTMFDCWMQEQEEGWQSKDIAACRKGFETAMKALEPAKRKKTATKPSGSPYTVYFRFDSVSLTEKSEGALYDIMQDIRLHKPKDIVITAYTDLVGNKTYNLNLAELRGKNIEDKLKSAGAKSVTVLAKGATDPVVDTTKPNQPNRRAIITFK